jgi:hypothetical protein
MSFLDDLLRTLRAPLDFVRGKTSAARGFEGRIVGDVGRIRNLPNEFRGEAEYNKQLVQQYGPRAKDLTHRAKNRFGKGGAAAPDQAPPAGGKKIMGLFSRKRRCPSCNEKLDARWELCPYCGFGGGAGDAPQGSQGGPPRTQALETYGGAPQQGGNKPRTMALDLGAAPAQQGGASAARLVGWIIPLDGPQGGQLLELRARAIVGTAGDCDVVVKDQSVSGRHAEFSAQGGAFRVSDLGSTNGTFVNDKRVQSSELVDGDTLRLGRTSFKFKST